MLALEAIMHNHRQMMVKHVQNVRERPRQVSQAAIDNAIVSYFINSKFKNVWGLKRFWAFYWGFLFIFVSGKSQHTHYWRICSDDTLRRSVHCSRRNSVGKQTKIKENHWNWDFFDENDARNGRYSGSKCERFGVIMAVNYYKFLIQIIFKFNASK